MVVKFDRAARGQTVLAPGRCNSLHVMSLAQPSHRRLRCLCVCPGSWTVVRTITTSQTQRKVHHLSLIERLVGVCTFDAAKMLRCCGFVPLVSSQPQAREAKVRIFPNHGRGCMLLAAVWEPLAEKEVAASG